MRRLAHREHRTVPDAPSPDFFNVWVSFTRSKCFSQLSGNLVPYGRNTARPELATPRFNTC